MIFDIRHSTRFTYTKPVFLEPLTIRLRPRSDCAQHPLHFDLQIDPQPAGLTACIDLDGNDTLHAWFDDLHDHLHLTAHSTVQTQRENPFNFVLSEEASQVPLQYAALLRPMLSPYLEREHRSGPVDDLAAKVLRDARGDTLRFLSMLTQHLYDAVKVSDREEGDPMSPQDTLRHGAGACRDSAVLFVDALRSVGLASRFVSGYVYDDPKPIDRVLHAWAEVYLPGAGWRGYDPTNGLAVADMHIVLASGSSYQTAAPTTGTFRGTGTSSVLEANIRMDVLENPQMQAQSQQM